jgi:16S rRNA (guanine(966)-N(2))-methyltransferase RsmD
MAREALFNILAGNFDFENIRVLDLFSGTGSISLEFASRGCHQITAVELNDRCAEFIRQVSERLGITGIKVIRANVFTFLNTERKNYDLIFADPPYALEGLETLPATIFKTGILNAGGWFIIEHPRTIDFSTTSNFFDHRHYGHVNFSFFHPVP